MFTCVFMLDILLLLHAIKTFLFPREVIKFKLNIMQKVVKKKKKNVYCCAYLCVIYFLAFIILRQFVWVTM